eukprot:m.99377 g.99377  ORF g.99377 m.99377 type:complete len:260 (-) comp12531_c3_seq5:2-781(-)
MSMHKEGMADSTLHAKELIERIFAVNGDMMQQFATTKEYTWFEGTDNATTTGITTPLSELRELIEEDDRCATDVACVILKELFAAKNRPNILLSIDEMNGLFEETAAMVDEDFNPIPPERLTIVRTLRSIVHGLAEEESLSRAALVGASSSCGNTLQQLNDVSRHIMLDSSVDGEVFYCKNNESTSPNQAKEKDVSDKNTGATASMPVTTLHFTPARLNQVEVGAIVGVFVCMCVCVCVCCSTLFGEETRLQLRRGSHL